MLDNRYDRDIDLETDNSSTKIIAKIAPEAVVLDVGCGPGVIGSYLRNKLNCTVDGIDLNEEFCQRARPFYRNVWQSDLATVDIGTLIGAHRYDRIVCADILEHLAEPADLLKSLPRVLSEGGRILISIPNFTHAAVVAELFCGRFEYRESGLLDRTHLRFFTRSSFIELLTSSGLRIFSFDTVDLDPQDTEFGLCILEKLEPPIFNAIVARPDASTYQFVVEVAPASTEINAQFSNTGVTSESLDAVSAYANSVESARDRIASLEKDLSRNSEQYRNHVEQLQEALSEQTAELNRQNVEVEFRGQELERKRYQVKELRAETERLRIELEKMDAELLLMQKEFQSCLSEKSKLESILNEVYTSKSWRITKPLRALGRHES